MLLLSLGCIQALVAAFTFGNLPSKPVDQRIRAQLSANVRAVAPVIDGELRDSASGLQRLGARPDLVAAIERKDKVAIERILTETLGAGPQTATTVASANGLAKAAGTASPTADETASVAYVTDATGQVIAGTEPTGVVVEQQGMTSTTVRRGAQLLGTVHLPVVLDEGFIHDRLGAYVGDDVHVFFADTDRLVDDEGSTARPHGLRKGVVEAKIHGKDALVLVQPVLDDGVLLGAWVPSKVVAAQKHEGQKSLFGFIFALVALTVVVSIAITRSVSGALRAFAELARELAAGQLHRRIPVTGDDEVATLSESINSMAENLELRIQNLIDARARMRRQVDLFGEALANATAVGEMLAAVCGLALESTTATHARFWTIDDEGRYAQAACIGLRPDDRDPCQLEREVTVRNQSLRADGPPHWLVVPARSGDTIVGLLSLATTGEPLTADDQRIAERLSVQAAVAIDNARMHEILRLQATRDGLTGLPNHRSLQDALEKNLLDAYRSHMPLGVALMDIDNFKRINDTYGHKVGDEAIKALAQVLSHGVGEMGMAARYGGEEFVVLMPGCDSAAACRIADRLREDITYIEIPLEDGEVLKFTASFGVANVDQNRTVVDNGEMLRQADVGLYNAKRTGKNRVVLATPEMEVMEMTDAEKAALAARERGDAAQAA